MKVLEDNLEVYESFHCDAYANNFFYKLKAFVGDRKFDDITLIADVDNRRFRAHRIILSVSSSYFFALFEAESKKTKKVNEILMKNIEGAVLESILDFIYTASIKLHSETVHKVLRAAQRMDLPTLAEACWQFMGHYLDSKNCLGVLQFAETGEFFELHKLASRFAYCNITEVYKETQFLELDIKQMKKFIFGAEVPAETVLFSIIDWIDYDLKHRKEFLLDLLTKVHFDLLNVQLLVNNADMIWKSSNPCKNLITNWIIKNTYKERTPKSSPRKEHTKLCYVGEDLTFRTLVPGHQGSIWELHNVIPYCNAKDNNAFNKSVIVIKEMMYIVGGKIFGYASNVAYQFDLNTKKLETLNKMNIARSSAGVAELNGNLYVIGGFDDNNWLKSVEMFHIATGKWRRIASLNEPLKRIKVAVAGGFIYAIGNDTRSMECYDPFTDTWNIRSFHIPKSSHFGVAGLDGCLYVVGGRYNGDASYSIERYDGLTNSWDTVAECETRRSSVQCVALDHKLIVCERKNKTWALCTQVKSYDPRTKIWSTLDGLLHRGDVIGMITM